MKPEQINIRSGEQLANQTIENAFIFVTGEDVRLSSLKLINCHLRLQKTRGLRAESIHFVGGLKKEQSATHIQWMKDGRLENISGRKVQRLILAEMGHWYHQCEVIIDGVYCREWVDWFGDTNRAEALCFHGYDHARKPPWLDLELRNAVVEEWSASWLTIWSTGVRRAIIRDCPAVSGPVQLGFSTVVAPCHRLAISGVNTDRPFLQYRTYDKMPTPDLLGDIELPAGWKHQLRNGGGRNPKKLGDYDTVAEVREQLGAAV